MAAIAATRPTSASFSLRLHGSRRSLSDTFAAVSQPSSVATSPQLRVSIGDAEFKKAGRYFLTLATSDVERRTSVAASSKTPNFSDSDYVFPLPFDSDDASSLAFLELSISVTQLAFSRGATTIGVTRLHLGESAKVNGGTQQAEAIVASAKGAILGTIQLQWSVEDPAAVERRAAERAAAAREREEQMRAESRRVAAEKETRDRATDLLLEATHEAKAKQAAIAEAEEVARMEEEAEEAARRAAKLQMAALEAERAAEEKLAWAAAWAPQTSSGGIGGGSAQTGPGPGTGGLPVTWSTGAGAGFLTASASMSEEAVRAVTANKVMRDKQREEEAIQRMAAEEEKRLADIARREHEAAECERIRRENLASKLRAEEEEMHAWYNQWESVLDSQVVLHRDDGWSVTLVGRQIVGLHDAMEQAGKGVVAFQDPVTGRRVVLSSAVTKALRTRLEGRMREEPSALATPLSVELPSTLRAATATAAAGPTGELTSWEKVALARPAASAPNGGDRPLSSQLRRSLAWAATMRSSSNNRVVPILE